MSTHLIKDDESLVQHTPVKELHALIEAGLCRRQLLIRQGVCEDRRLVLCKRSSILSLSHGTATARCNNSNSTATAHQQHIQRMVGKASGSIMS